MTPQERAAFEFEKIDPFDYESVGDAIDWARKTLTEREGAGHLFHLHATKNLKFQCSFAKPEWGGDHMGNPMDEAPAAIVMSVCEYLAGC